MYVYRPAPMHAFIPRHYTHIQTHTHTHTRTHTYPNTRFITSHTPSHTHPQTNSYNLHTFIYIYSLKYDS